MVVYKLHGEAEDLLAAVDERLLDKEDEEARAKLVRLLRLDLPIWGTLQQHEPPGGKMYGIMREPRARERMQRDELIEQLVRDGEADARGRWGRGGRLEADVSPPLEAPLQRAVLSLLDDAAQSRGQGTGGTGGQRLPEHFLLLSKHDFATPQALLQRRDLVLESLLLGSRRGCPRSCLRTSACEGCSEGGDGVLSVLVACDELVVETVEERRQVLNSSSGSSVP